MQHVAHTQQLLLARRLRVGGEVAVDRFAADDLNRDRTRWQDADLSDCAVGVAELANECVARAGKPSNHGTNEVRLRDSRSRSRQQIDETTCREPLPTVVS